MKKLFLALFLFINLTQYSIAQDRNKVFATFSGTKYSFNLNLESQRSVYEKFKTYFKYDGSFSKLSIEDPEPFNPESNAYAVFDGLNTKSNKFLSTYFKLNKSISKGLVTYRIDFSGIETGIALGGSCSGDHCSSCRKVRNWFLGPVVRCDCLVQAPGHTDGFCNHSTGSGNDWWNIILGVLPFLL